MSPLRLWMIMMIITGALTGYTIASGIGVVFCGAKPLPFVGGNWWMPIVMLVFLIVVRFVFHEELHGRIIKDDQDENRN